MFAQTFCKLFLIFFLNKQKNHGRVKITTATCYRKIKDGSFNPKYCTLPPTHDAVQTCEIDKFAQMLSAFIELTEKTATVKEQ